MNLAGLFDQSLNELFGQNCPARLGVAVSGGSDSTALLHLLASWAATQDCNIVAVTVDHGLREGGLAEADAVAQQCGRLGVSHSILSWTGWKGSGNLQDQARRARYKLMGDWGAQQGITHITLGHTRDDQAETVLMRLARGSGIDGLSAMAPLRHGQGVQWLRPMLNMSRGDLRAYLRARHVDWIEDPSNEDTRFDRIKMREALDVLEPLGVTRQGLADTAARMRSARNVMSVAAYDAAQEIAEVSGGTVNLDVAGLFELPGETRRRLLVHGLCWVANEEYPPRSAAMSELEDSIRDARTATLHGCLISVVDGNCSIGREPAAVAQTVAHPGAVWDGRWRLNGPEKDGQMIRSTGDNGLKLCDKWREIGLSRATLNAAPSVWLGNVLVAAPLAGFANGWTAELTTDTNHYYNTILTH